MDESEKNTTQTPQTTFVDPPDGELLNNSMIEMFKLVGQRKGKDILGVIFGCYLDNYERLIEELLEAQSSEDFHTIEASAHSLKSSSAQVGAIYLSSLYETVERAAVIHAHPRDKESFREHLLKTQHRVIDAMKTVLSKKADIPDIRET